MTELLPGGVKRERTYDGLGRLTRETGSGAEASTTTRTLEHDLVGRLTAIGTADGLTRDTYTYNDRGALLTAEGPGGSSSYAYNADGSMIQRTTGAGATDYTYDAAGRIDTVRDSITGNNVLYDFDAAGRPSVEQYAAGQTVTAKRTYGYDPLGRVQSDTVASPDGTTTAASTTYGYDLDDNLTSKKTTGTAGAGTNTYAYDHANRMTSWTKDGTAMTSYEWDAGNRIKAGSRTATFDNRNRQLTDGTTTYTYTARGTLSSVNTGNGPARSLTFDAFERKITDGGTTYSYDSLDRVQTHDSTTFTYDGGSNNLASDGTTDYNRTPEGSLLSLSTGTTKQWALTDQHTDLVAGLAADGRTVSGSTSYDPFGKETATNGTTPAVGYQSGWTDPASGDVNLAARWYQPGTGTFGSRDTWQLDPMPSVQANRYTYANGGPLNGIDPTGHFLADGGGGRGPIGPMSPANISIGRSFRFRTGPGEARISEQRVRSLPAKPNRGILYVGGGGSPSSLADALRNQAYRLSSGLSSGPEVGWSGLVDTGYGRGYTPGTGTSTSTGSGGCQHGCVVIPPAPPIDQNPNNGPKPTPAPTRAKPKAERVDAIWTAGQGVSATVTAQAMLDLAVLAIFSPSDALETLPIPKDNPGGKNNGRTRRDNKCDIGPGVSATGHAVYLPRERYYDTFEERYECRATGVYGLLDKSDYNKGRSAPGTNTNGSTQPPGMREIASQGHVAANGHLIPAAASGSGIDLRNLVAEYKETNTPYLNHGVEKEIRNAIKSGKHLAISVVPHYGNGGSGIPTEIEYNYGTVEDGKMKHCVITQSPSGGTTRGSTDCPRR